MSIILYNGGVAKRDNVKLGKIGRMGKIAWMGSMSQQSHSAGSLV